MRKPLKPLRVYVEVSRGPTVGGQVWWNFIWAHSDYVSFWSIQGGSKKKFEKKILLPLPHFHLKKISWHFWGVFRKNHSNGCPDLKNKGRSIFLSLCFNSSIEEQKLVKKKFIKFHLHGSRGQKDAQKSHFCERLTLGPYKKNENERLIFLVSLAYYKLSEVFENIKLSSVRPFLGSQC